MAEVLWDDAPNDPAKIEVWGCADHLHMTIAVPGTELGFNLVLDRHEAAGLCRKLLDGMEAKTRDAEFEYDTSELWIA